MTLFSTFVLKRFTYHRKIHLYGDLFVCGEGGECWSIIIQNKSPAHVSNLFHFEFEEIYLIAVELLSAGELSLLASYRHSRDRYG